MKFKLSKVIMVCAAMMLSACGNEAEETAKIRTNETATQKVTVTETAVNATTVGEADVQGDKLTDEALYEAFLKDEAPVYANRVDYQCWYQAEPEDLFEKNKGYSLSEFVGRAFQASMLEWGGSELVDVEYAYIDCGNDGIKELTVRITTNNDVEGETVDEYIIKDFDGQLEICYRTESAYRYYEYLNGDKGVITEGGSNGAASWVEGMYYLDAQGEVNFIYDACYEYGTGAFYGFVEDFNIVDEEYQDLLWSNDCYFAEFRFDDPAGYDYENDDYRDYFVNSMLVAYFDEDDEEFAGELEALYEEYSLPIATEEEAQERINAAMLEKGLSIETYENSNEIEYQPLRNDKIEEYMRYGYNPIYVDSVDGLIRNIKNNANIVLAPGTYNVTEYMRKNPRKIKYYDYETIDAPGALYIGNYEEPELIIYGYDNLTIQSLDENNMAEIVSEPRYENVITFTKCDHLNLKNVIAGHTPDKGSCSGDVIGLHKCENARIAGCDLYGCGAYGLDLQNCGWIECSDTVIHDCSYGCATIYDTSYIIFSNCEFVDCEQFEMFEIIDSRASFIDCSLHRLNGKMLRMNAESSAYFNSCVFDANALASINNYAGDGTVTVY